MQKTKDELVRDKIVQAKDLQHLCHGWRVKGHKIVFTNGCFDLLHSGHITLLLAAAEMGQKLVVALNTDSSVRRLKGAGRPVYDQDARALLLAAQLYVDAVVLFDEDTPLELIKLVEPDVLVKGGDYQPETVVGNDIVTQRGGKVAIIPLVAGVSTSITLKKLT